MGVDCQCGEYGNRGLVDIGVKTASRSLRLARRFYFRDEGAALVFRLTPVFRRTAPLLRAV